MKIFLVCPVRNVGKRETQLIRAHVAQLEAKGHKVYWPYRDTNQNDKTGLNIIVQNRQAIRKSDEIHFWWKADKKGKSKSEGSVFDFGMTWAFIYSHPKKKIRLANPKMIKLSENKSFTNVLLLLDKIHSTKK